MNTEKQHYIIHSAACGPESTAALLSIAVLPFDLVDDQTSTTKDLAKRTWFYKIDVRDQIYKGRSVDKRYLEDWKYKADDQSKKRSLTPSPADLSPSFVLSELIKQIKPNDSTFWVRGAQQGSYLESLCRTYNVDPGALTPHWNYRELNTFFYLHNQSQPKVVQWDPVVEVVMLAKAFFKE